jgi:O-succinylbenzoate synthase
VHLRSSALYCYRLPFSQPLTLKGVTLHHREGLLLRLTGDDESEGWGERAPLPGFSRENPDEAATQLRRLVDSMTGREATDDWVDPDGDFSRVLDRIDLAPSVRFGFELAVWNLYASCSGRELPELVTPYPRRAVPVNGLLSGPPEEVLDEVRRMWEAGYRSIKLKVGELAAGTEDRMVPAGLDTYRRFAGDVLEVALDLPAPSVDVRETAEASRTIDVRKLKGF